MKHYSQNCVPGLLRTLAIISATTGQNSAADQEDQKLFLKIKKKALFLEVIYKHNIYYHYLFTIYYFNIYYFIYSLYLLIEFTNHRQKTSRVVFLSFRPLTNIIKYRDHRSNLPTIYKISFLQTHIQDLSWYV